jgi:hypothetical protein
MIEICISCVESVEWGSGRFVNRVPTDDGWLCEECVVIAHDEVIE